MLIIQTMFSLQSNYNNMKEICPGNAQSATICLLKQIRLKHLKTCGECQSFLFSFLERSSFKFFWNPKSAFTITCLLLTSTVYSLSPASWEKYIISYLFYSVHKKLKLKLKKFEGHCSSQSRMKILSTVWPGFFFLNFFEFRNKVQLWKWLSNFMRYYDMRFAIKVHTSHFRNNLGDFLSTLSATHVCSHHYDLKLKIKRVMIRLSHDNYN